MSDQLAAVGSQKPGRKVNVVSIVTLLTTGFIIVPGLYQTGTIGIETVNMLGRYLCFALLALSLDLIWGYGGMLCLCQSFFFSLGGYAMGMFLSHHGGPEGILDANGWKLPASLFIVYPLRGGAGTRGGPGALVLEALLEPAAHTAAGHADPRAGRRTDRILRLPQPCPGRVLRRRRDCWRGPCTGRLPARITIKQRVDRFCLRDR